MDAALALLRIWGLFFIVAAGWRSWAEEVAMLAIDEAPNPDVLLLSSTPPDLSGTPLPLTEPRKKNVLLVMLEGVSGAYLPSLRDWQGVQDAPEGDDIFMPKLDSLLCTMTELAPRCGHRAAFIPSMH